MAKMTIRFILKSGAEFTTKCDEFTLKQNALGVTGYNIKGITEGKPVYIDFPEVAAIVRTYSDEGHDAEEPAPEDEKKLGFTETKVKCPFCEGENKNAVIYEDKENKEYFVYCPVCGIETKDIFKSKAKAVKAFSEGETKKIKGSEGADR